MSTPESGQPNTSHLTEHAGQAATGREAHLLNLLRACRRWVEEAGTIQGYGFYRPENPHDFSPDPESCSDEEMANHKAACEAWDRGDYKAPLGSETIRNENGEFLAHILRAPWGVGSYTDTIPEVADLLAAIDCALSRNVAATGSQP
jgi:hypothetical protein